MKNQLFNIKKNINLNPNQLFESRANYKERRTAKLIIANKQLAFQNHEKDKHALQLISAITKLHIDEEFPKKTLLNWKN